MKSTDKKITIFLYNRLFDPLIQSNFWLYIKDFLSDPKNDIQFHLITYENPDFPLTKEQSTLVDQWKSLGLEWKQLTWNPGTGLLPKFMDIFQGLVAIASLRFKGSSRVVSLGSVAGTFVYLYSRLTGVKFFLYQFEPHSEYAIDNNMWAKESFQYRLSHLLERKAAYSAKVIASGTRFMKERLKDVWRVKATFFKIPTVANNEKFIFNESLRKRKRMELGFADDQQILFYPGKFGDLYYREETAFMFKWFSESLPKLHFLIVTPHSDEEVVAMFDLAQVDPKNYTIAHSDYENIQHFYNAADFAVIAVPPGPSKKFISNIKVGEYLCSGLPFLITEGVSEDYLYATEQKVGVVVKDFQEEYIKDAAPYLKQYLESNKDELRKHCRKVGLDYRGFDKLNQIFKQAIYELVS